jgi:hypothetical protein
VKKRHSSGWAARFLAVVSAVAAVSAAVTYARAISPSEPTASAASALVDSQPDPAGGLRCTYQGNGSSFTVNTKLPACVSTASAPGSVAPGTPAAAAAAAGSSKAAASADPAIKFVAGSPKLIKWTPAASGGLVCTYELKGSFFTRTTHRAQCPPTVTPPASASTGPVSKAATPRAPTSRQTPAPPGEGTLIGSESKGTELVCKYKVGNQTFTRTTKKSSCPEHVRAP